jgi:hypothetical protein
MAYLISLHRGILPAFREVAQKVDFCPLRGRQNSLPPARNRASGSHVSADEARHRAIAGSRIEAHERGLRGGPVALLLPAYPDGTRLLSGDSVVPSTTTNENLPKQRQKIRSEIC